MSIILYNPYRVVGVLINSTLRERTKQVNRLSQYIDAGRTILDDFSFPILGKLQRTESNLQDAVTKLSLDNDKVLAALFWFYSSNEITDEPAFDFLKALDSRSALDIWSKLTASGIVNDRNHSAFQNLSSLLFFEYLKNPSSNFSLFERALELKVAYLESDFYSQLIIASTDQTYKISRKALQVLYFEHLLIEFSRIQVLSEIQLLRMILLLNFSGKVSFLVNYADKYIRAIDALIDTAAENRKKNKRLSHKIGKDISTRVLEDLSVVEAILGKDNSKYFSVSDRVAESILESAIDYFNYYQDSDTDPGSSARQLIKIASKLACGSISIQRCKEHLTFIQNWVNEKPERDRINQSKVILESLWAIIENFGDRSETVNNAKRLLSDSLPALIQLKTILGSKNDLYLLLSTRIASDALSMCIGEINNFSNFDLSDPKLTAIERLDRSSLKYGSSLTQKSAYNSVINQAWSIILIIDGMDLNNDFIIELKKNRAVLYDIKSSISTPLYVSRRQTQSSSSTKTGCYIATMAYGDYNHPQVLILRTFRDTYLSKSFAGRKLIEVYYKFSPFVVKKLKHSTLINSLIRNILDLIIKLFRIK